MSCNFPLRATLLPGKRVVMGGDPKGSGRPLSLPCGKCIGCKMERSRMWSVRIVHEASLFDKNWFVTLDYAPEHLPASLSLEYEDFQLFMKRLRKKWRGDHVCPNGEQAIRFFVAGEYGAQYHRPHWHVILFNLDIPDKVEFHNETYRSSELERLWGKGHAVIGSVTARSAAYVAGYTLFKGGHSEEYGVVDTSTGEVTERRQELVVMSRNPGIGAWWYEKYSKDVFPLDKAVMAEGRINKVPRFYLERLKVEDPLLAEEVAEERYFRAMERGQMTDAQRDGREEYYRRKMSTFTRREH